LTPFRVTNRVMTGPQCRLHSAGSGLPHRCLAQADTRPSDSGGGMHRSPGRSSRQSVERGHESALPRRPSLSRD
jgi:hypothetical protein